MLHGERVKLIYTQKGKEDYKGGTLEKIKVSWAAYKNMREQIDKEIPSTTLQI